MIDDQPSTGNKKKNTNKNCKGKTGVAHDWEIVYARVSHLLWSRLFIEFECRKCGKQKVQIEPWREAE